MPLPAADQTGATTDQTKAGLAAAWRQWSMSIPAAVHPLSFHEQDDSADYCGVGQHGKVWFLGGTLDGTPLHDPDRPLHLPAHPQCGVLGDRG